MATPPGGVAIVPLLTPSSDPDDLFPDLDLGDTRRTRRFDRVVAAFAANPGSPLPQLIPDPSAYQAALRVFDTDACTHAIILAAHQVTALDLDARTDSVLLLQDATLLDASGHTTLEGALGPIGNGGRDRVSRPKVARRSPHDPGRARAGQPGSARPRAGSEGGAGGRPAGPRQP
ncbi:hypothetical protein J0H58_31310 [bacterium]|nr:hypothetical protein [bacterium]